MSEKEFTSLLSPEPTSEGALKDLVSSVVREVLTKMGSNGPWTTTKAAFKPETPPLRRRSSLLRPGKDHLDESEEISKGPEIISGDKKVNVVYPDKEIKEEDKMQILSLPSVIHFKRKMDARNSESIVKIKLQRFISNKVMEDIWNYENRKQTEFVWTGHYEDLFTLEHDKFMRILARRLRPTTHEAYCKVLASCVPRFKKVPTNFTLASPNYDQILFQQVANYFKTVSEVDEFVRFGATPEEKEHLPRLELGKEDSKTGLGVFGIAIAMLGPRFADDYKRLVGVDALKACKSMNEFIDLVSQVNIELANKSEKERIERKELQPKLTFKELSQLVNQESSSALDGPPHVPYPKDGVQKRLFAVQDELDEIPEESQTVADDDLGLDTATIYENPHSDADPEQFFFVKTHKDKPPERVLPCYQYFDGKCTAGSACTYSHDPVVLTAYAKDQLQRLVRSKYISADDLVKAAKEKGTAISKPMPDRPPPQPQDARLLPTGRGPGQLRLFTHPRAITADDTSNQDS
jgi:hypothetical protein